MEKSVPLNQAETQLVQQFDQERTNALAMYGALTMDIKNAEKQVEAAMEKQRAFLRSTLITKGYTQYDNARLVNNNTEIVISVPDQPQGFQEVIEPVPSRKGANGPAKTIAEK